jgi:hypothetical protein
MAEAVASMAEAAATTKFEMPAAPISGCPTHPRFSDEWDAVNLNLLPSFPDT